jgi:drug/metabolite transporter (DMT)-like permease
MVFLLAVSILWAFSFGLIKGRLAGLDPVAVSAVRMAFAAAVFLPFLRPRALPRRDVISLSALGAVQFGLMYVLYITAFGYLKAHEVALATTLTPAYVALLDAAVENRTRWRHMAAAGLAVAGAAILIWENHASDSIITGFLIVQAANLCFAAGQIAYKRIRPTLPAGLKDSAIFFWPCAGALAATSATSLLMTDWGGFAPSVSQWAVLAYLGVLASGAGFFLWNYGALHVNTGTLAAFNNAKVPLAVACSLLFFGETPESIPRLLASLTLLALAVMITARDHASDHKKKAGPGGPAR